MWIYQDYCRCYTRRTWCPTCLIRKIYSSTTTHVLSNAIPFFPPFLQCIHFNVSLLVGACQHALTKLAISRWLFHVANWFRTVSTFIELQNTIMYGNSLIECAGSAYEQHADLCDNLCISENVYENFATIIQGNSMESLIFFFFAQGTSNPTPILSNV